ncbi:hemin uptake protein HemP [Polaromonas sp.]|uniref:hemin uptake protein HemP n=1 Tax=Polaromonas sp. TaxID=1869339 RepID=UPI00286CB20D|nr:hemin uptake protein HemP [Polaromonas sp.]
MDPSSKPSDPSGERAGPDSAPAAGAQAASLSSAEILRGHKAVEIRHNGLTYRLQATRLGKLILTK